MQLGIEDPPTTSMASRPFDYPQGAEGGVISQAHPLSQPMVASRPQPPYLAAAGTCPQHPHTTYVPTMFQPGTTSTPVKQKQELTPLELEDLVQS